MSLERLKSLQRENDAAGAEMLIESERFNKLSVRHEQGTAPRAVSGFNLFQTPREVARLMCSLLPQHPGRILEPSAGLGRIYKALTLYTSDIVLIENNPECCKELYNTKNIGTGLLQRDFLTVSPVDIGVFDAVVMNPPFKLGRDIKHIQHALKFLSKGGLLIALCYNGVRQNKILKPLSSTWEVLPDNSFKAEGTGASVVLLTLINGET